MPVARAVDQETTMIETDIHHKRWYQTLRGRDAISFYLFMLNLIKSIFL